MNIEELKNIWQAQDEQITNKVQINQELLRRETFRKVKSLLRSSQFESIFEVIVNIAFLGTFINCAIDNVGNYKFFLPAIFLVFSVIFSLVWNIYKLSEIYKINYKYSIVKTQERISRLNLYERWETNVLLILIPLFSTSFLIVSLKVFLGIDISDYYENWLLHYLLGSAIVGIIIVGFLKKFPDKKKVKAEVFLKEISNFSEDK